MAITFQQSLDEITRLVRQFETNRNAYLGRAYNEAQTRQDLIDPLFVALGWDVHNQEHVASDYKLVEFEVGRQGDGGRRRAPDYTFRMSKRDPKFFEEDIAVVEGGE